jgi:hypothetical protein
MVHYKIIPEILYFSVILVLCVRQCLLLLSRHNPGIDTVRLHVLNVSAYRFHHEIHRALTIARPSLCCTSLHWPTQDSTNTEQTQTSMPRVDSNPRSQCLSGRRHFMP